MAKKAAPTERIAIKPIKLRTMVVPIKGNAPYVQHAFAQEEEDKIRGRQEAGLTSGSRKDREKKDFEAAYKGSTHFCERPDTRDKTGWIGIPAAAFRSACIDVCRMVGFKMTFAKMSIFVLPDGITAQGTPLVKIYGEPERYVTHVRLPNGSIDVRIRPMWRDWSAKVRMQFDEDQFTAGDVVNLLSRAGLQVGIGEGRPFSRNSSGMGWGTFVVEATAEAAMPVKEAA